MIDGYNQGEEEWMKTGLIKSYQIKDGQKEIELSEMTSYLPVD